MYERVLIAGGAGFVGSSVGLALKRAFPASEVIAFDNLRRRGSELNLRRLAEGGVRFAHGDVRSAEDLGAVPAPGLVIDASAEASAQAGYGGSPAYLVRTNVGGCFECLETARRHGADFLFLSTSRVYPAALLNGLPYREDETRFTLLDAPGTPGASAGGIAEEFPLNGARSLYGMTKLASELMVMEYGEAYGLRTAIDRCGVIAGPWQMGKVDQGVAALWVAAHYFRRPLEYIGFGGAGKQVRDLLHIDDLCDLVTLQAGCMERFSGRVFNVGGGPAGDVSLREMTAACQEITGNRIAIGSCARERPADIRIYTTDHRQVTALCGWAPRRGPREVLADIGEWIRAEEDLVRPVLAT